MNRMFSGNRSAELLPGYSVLPFKIRMAWPNAFLRIRAPRSKVVTFWTKELIVMRTEKNTIFSRGSIKMPSA